MRIAEPRRRVNGRDVDVKSGEGIRDACPSILNRPKLVGAERDSVVIGFVGGDDARRFPGCSPLSNSDGIGDICIVEARKVQEERVFRRVAVEDGSGRTLTEQGASNGDKGREGKRSESGAGVQGGNVKPA